MRRKRARPSSHRATTGARRCAEARTEKGESVRLVDVTRATTGVFGTHGKDKSVWLPLRAARGVISRGGARVPVSEERDERDARAAAAPRLGGRASPGTRATSVRWRGAPSDFAFRPILVRFGEDVRRVVQDGEARGPRRGVQGQGRPRVFARAGQKRQRGAVAATRGDAFGVVDTGTSFVGSHQISKDSAPYEKGDSLSATTSRAFGDGRRPRSSSRGALTVPRHT